MHARTYLVEEKVAEEPAVLGHGLAREHDIERPVDGVGQGKRVVAREPSARRS